MRAGRHPMIAMADRPISAFPRSAAARPVDPSGLAACLVLAAGCTGTTCTTSRSTAALPGERRSSPTASRPGRLVAGTVARGQLRGRPARSTTGRSGGQARRRRSRSRSTARSLERGPRAVQDLLHPLPRPHGRRPGDDRPARLLAAAVVPRAERARADAPVGHFFDVITHGHGAMYSYASRVAPDDRWAIAAYIRALQLSQHATARRRPARRRAEPEAAGGRRR